MKTLGMVAAVDIGVTILVSLGLLLLILSAGSDCWRQDAKDPMSSVGLSVRCRGLWSECLFDNVASLWTCDIPVSYLSEHPAVLVGARVLVILSGILLLLAIPPFVAGMQCVKVLQGRVSQKYRLSLAAGVFFLLGGLCGAAAVLWYGLDTVQKYKLEVSFAIPGVTYEFGYSYWAVAAGAICAISSGIVLLTANCLSVQVFKKDQNLLCRPPDSRDQRTYL